MLLSVVQGDQSGDVVAEESLPPSRASSRSSVVLPSGLRVCGKGRIAKHHPSSNQRLIVPIWTDNKTLITPHCQSYRTWPYKRAPETQITNTEPIMRTCMGYNSAVIVFWRNSWNLWMMPCGCLSNSCPSDKRSPCSRHEMQPMVGFCGNPWLRLHRWAGGKRGPRHMAPENRKLFWAMESCSVWKSEHCSVSPAQDLNFQPGCCDLTVLKHLKSLHNNALWDFILLCLWSVHLHTN